MNDQALVERARNLDREGLIALWEQVQARHAVPWPPGKALECLVIRAFELEAAGTSERVAVTWPMRNRSRYLPTNVEVEQLDGVVHLPFGHFLVECKDQAPDRPVDVGPIAQLRLRLEGRPPMTMGMVFSSSGFTEPARYFTDHLRPLNVLLWVGSDLDWGLRNGMIALAERKLRAAVEERLTDYSPYGDHPDSISESKSRDTPLLEAP